MALPQNLPRCGVCDSKLVKNGATSAGKTRWRCKRCGSSTTQSRPDITGRADIDAFVGWLRGKDSQREAGGGTGRSFRRHTSWCWNVDVPQPAPLREVPRQIMVDGTYFADWCVLVAHDGQAVIAWQWCNQESKTAWGQLIKRLPAPDVVVTDGGAGLRSALDTYWPDTKVQRCYFHIYATVRRHTTLKPRLQAGKEILALTRQLMHVSDLDDAAAWMSDYAAWETRWADLLAERTYASRNSERPKWAKVGQRWWFTHVLLRRVRGLYRHLIRDHALFTWLDDTYLDNEGKRTVERTTSRLEGGPNNAIKYLLRHHRGLRNHHAPRAIDWLLNSLTEHPHDPWQLAKATFKARQPQPHNSPSTSQPAPTTTAPASPQKKASGPEKAGPDTNDTPNPYTHSGR